MTIDNILLKFFRNQAELASLIAGGAVTNSARIKANRIWNGTRRPNNDEVQLIYSFTGGQLDANYFAGLPSNANKAKKHRSK